MKRAIVWFRNDLRIHDNQALAEACKAGEILPLYCFDPRHFKRTQYGFEKTGSFRANFLRESIIDLRKSIRNLGGELIIRFGMPEVEISKLVQEHAINNVFVHKEITKEETDVEEAVNLALEIPVTYFWGNTLYHIEEVLSQVEDIPDVFSTFRKKIEKKTEVRKLISAPDFIPLIEGVNPGVIPELSELGIEKKSLDPRTAYLFMGGETNAIKRLQEYIWEQDLLKNYKFTRNGMLGADYSTKFSPWLANGTLSPRKIYWEVKKYEQERTKNVSTYWLIFELIWRDFFKFSALKHGDRIFHKGGIQRKNREWSTNKTNFWKWANGETGFPFIDANMIELNETGFMSNRGRQNVASFLAQNLNIDWRMGAEYFESLLLDYDPCSNYGNWAYNATVGHDPRNRYFNILNQAERYDKKGDYVRHWLPKLKHVPKELVHQSYTIQTEEEKLYEIQIGIDYPKPMINLEKSYEEIKNRA
ncbi:MAG: DASH family cryptochrome [Balneolaceae bacterium]